MVSTHFVVFIKALPVIEGHPVCPWGLHTCLLFSKVDGPAAFHLSSGAMFSDFESENPFLSFSFRLLAWELGTSPNSLW